METRQLNVTSEEFGKLREESERVCVIPMGCLEKHSVYLPLGTDVIIANNMAYDASQLETVCVFPDFAFGDVPCGDHAARPDGTIALDVRIQMLLLENLCDEIAANGFNKILVVNQHGGNLPWLQTFARNLGCKAHKYVFAYADVPDSVPHQMGKFLLENGSGSIPELTTEDEDLIIKYYKADMQLGHACMQEAAFTLECAPETVHLDRLGKENGSPRDIPELQKLLDLKVRISMGGWDHFYPDWFSGDDPYGLNERIAKAATRISVEKLAEIYKAFKEDKFLLRRAKENYKDKTWFE